MVPKPKKALKEKIEKPREVDPWDLAKTKSWKSMSSPSLAMFAQVPYTLPGGPSLTSATLTSFNRIVIDEFTYLDHAQLTAIRTFRASSRWILSGTPPLKDFGELKTRVHAFCQSTPPLTYCALAHSIAALLQVHLGIDDENETTDKSVKAKKEKERTAAEAFHSFKEVRTAKWHARRDQIGQKCASPPRDPRLPTRTHVVHLQS